MSDLLRVLLVVDNSVEADLIAKLLTGAGSTQFKVKSITRFSKALECVGADRFDVVLLDIGLPVSKGLAKLGSIRQKAARLPIVVLTGISDEQVALAAIQEGAQDFFVKGQTDKSQLAWKIKFAVERKHAAEREYAAEAKYRQLHKSMMDAFFRVDMSGRFIECNGAYMDLLGYTEEEIRRLTYADITPVRWHAVEAGIIDQQVLSRGYSDVYEKEYRRKDGTLVPIEIRTMLLKDESGRPSSMWGIIRNITERKQAEAELKSSEEFTRNILSSIDEAFVVIDREYQIVSANRAFCEQTGMPLADIIGKHCYEISHCLTRPCHEVDLKCLCKRTFETGETSIFSYKLTKEEGNKTHLETKTYAMKDESGDIKSVIEIINDVTEKNNLETQLRQSQKMEAIGTLAGGIAHDFNNSLTAIIGFGYMTLLKMAPDDPLRENIENMLEGADRAAHLTKDLLLFSRKHVSEKSPVDLNEIIGKVEKFLLRVIGEDINCRLAQYNEPIVVYADPHQIEQVLMNLATNARDAIAKAGDLIISVEQIAVENDFETIHGYGKPGKYALLTISDTGKGMDEETRQKIFDPFFTTKGIGEGTGLGLAVVYGIVKEHEGFINVYSEPGAGTTFKIYLPLISSEVREEEITPEKEILAKGTETILLAEDDETVRNLISIVLNQEGYTVIEAVDGADAVKKFMENKETIQLLLSDLMMPAMNGKEAYDEMKIWRPGLKSIFVSGYAPEVIEQKMLLESGVVLMSKPIMPYSLLKKVRNLLDEDKK